MNPIDVYIFKHVNGLAGQNVWFDTFMAHFTSLSSFMFIAIFGVCFFLPPRRKEMRQSIVLAGLSGMLSIALSLAIGALFYRERPFVALPPDQIRPLISHLANSSFPSTHAIGSAGLALPMLRFPSPLVRWVTMVMALLVGVSRIIVGVHWPSDVISSFLLGGLVAGMVVFLSPVLLPGINHVLDVVYRSERYVRRLLRLEGKT